MNKKIHIYTDDKNNSDIILSISGKVNEFAKMDEKYARLVGPVGSEIEKTITITLIKANPFKILSAKAKDGKDIEIDLTPFKKEDAKGYVLTIKNKKTEAGRYLDTILLTTDSKIQPTIRVPVYGQIIAKVNQPESKTPKKSTGHGG